MARRKEAAPRGREAPAPHSIPLEGWKDIGSRVLHEFQEDRVTLIAAGATYFSLLAVFPALAAFVSIYGFFADPETITQHVATLRGVLPEAAVGLIEDRLKVLADQGGSTLSIGVIGGFGLALWSANNGIKTLFTALNIAYEEREKRSFLRLNAQSLLFTLGAFAVAILLIFSVGVIPAILAFAGLGEQTGWLISVLRWPVLFVILWGAIAVIHRYGPSRNRARWRWVAVGSFLTAFVWLAASMLFSWYLQNFANYERFYGSLGAIIGVLVWVWISSIIFIMGAEVNAEIEHQTQRDSTTGPEKPLGWRGAHMADTIGMTRGERKEEKNAPPEPRTVRGPPERPVRPWLLLALGVLSLAARRDDNK